MNRRMERVNELLLQSISKIILQRQHPDIGFITFTGVETTDDLLEAKVFYSVLGTEEDRHRTADALHSLRREIFQGLRPLESLKYIPTLHFIFDDTAVRAARVAELLEGIHHEEKPHEQPPETDPPSAG
jgi:ribosome-binding factor A